MERERAEAAVTPSEPARVAPPAAVPLLGNRALARAVGGQEAAADRVAMHALGVRGNRALSVAGAVSAVTGRDVTGVPVLRERLPPGKEGRVRGGVVSLAPGAGGDVLAHELAHVALGHDTDGGPHYFETSERPRIGSLDDVMNEARTIAERESLISMDWGSFVRSAGGATPGAIVSSGNNSGLRKRYVYTVRCGLVDMRHFYQLMYIGLMLGNRDAVAAGRDHELTSEETSRFAPEDTVSNALGALFGSRQSTWQRVSTFLTNLRAFLDRCVPADWSRMTAAEQDTVVNFYGARNSDGRPTNANETSTPRPPVTTTAAAGPVRGIFPFVQAVGSGNEWNMFTDVVD